MAYRNKKSGSVVYYVDSKQSSLKVLKASQGTKPGLQVSMTVADPDTKKPIGAVTIGVGLVEFIQLGAVE